MGSGCHGNFEREFVFANLRDERKCCTCFQSADINVKKKKLTIRITLVMDSYNYDETKIGSNWAFLLMTINEDGFVSGLNIRV